MDGMSALFRVSITAKDCWSKHYLKKVGPIYVAAQNKGDAISIVNGHIKDGLVIKSVSRLAEQVSCVMFVGGDK